MEKNKRKEKLPLITCSWFEKAELELFKSVVIKGRIFHIVHNQKQLKNNISETNALMGIYLKKNLIQAIKKTDTKHKWYLFIDCVSVLLVQ